jgi:hypothetical protein
MGWALFIERAVMMERRPDASHALSVNSSAVQGSPQRIAQRAAARKSIGNQQSAEEGLRRQMRRADHPCICKAQPQHQTDLQYKVTEENCKMENTDLFVRQLIMVVDHTIITPIFLGSLPLAKRDRKTRHKGPPCHLCLGCCHGSNWFAVVHK